MGKGTLVAQIFTARMAIPIEGAVVTITKEDGGEIKLLAYEETDVNGKTFPMEFDTPDISQSETPEGEKPFVTVNIQIDKPLYYSILVKNVQIFPEQESLQQTEMLPLPYYVENSEKERQIVYEVRPQNL